MLNLDFDNSIFFFLFHFSCIMFLLYFSHCREYLHFLNGLLSTFFIRNKNNNNNSVLTCYLPSNLKSYFLIRFSCAELINFVIVCNNFYVSFAYCLQSI